MNEYCFVFVKKKGIFTFEKVLAWSPFPFFVICFFLIDCRWCYAWSFWFIKNVAYTREQTKLMFLAYNKERNASNTLFWTLSLTLSLTLTLLLDEIHACPTTLCGFYFQSVHSQWFKPIKEWVLERVFKRECTLT